MLASVNQVRRLSYLLGSLSSRYHCQTINGTRKLKNFKVYSGVVTFNTDDNPQVITLCNIVKPKVPYRLLSSIDDHSIEIPINKTNKMATIISGTKLAGDIKTKLKTKLEQEKLEPCLAIVQVGNREDSNVYIRMKIQFAESIGASANLIKLPSTISEVELVGTINKLNQDDNVHGIITQLPFNCDNKIDADKITNMIAPHKDVDGLSVVNAGKLLHGDLTGSSFIPCTPNGCLEIIKKAGIKIEGTRSVVIGRSKIVGSPMAQLLVWNNSTVTICHSMTKNLESICRDADIIVVAVGRPQMVKHTWIKPGAVIIDCGINCIPDATKKSGTRLVGDVDYEDCKLVAGAITPVPGGVGPMTVAMLIANTVEAASRAKNR